MPWQAGLALTTSLPRLLPPQCFWLFLIFYGMPAKLDRFKIPSQCDWFTNPTEYDFNGMPAGYCCNPNDATATNSCTNSAYLQQSEWGVWRGHGLSCLLSELAALRSATS